MSFLIARSGTSTPSLTVLSSAWTSRKARRVQPQPHLRHSPDTNLRQDLPLLPERAGPQLHRPATRWLANSLSMLGVILTVKMREDEGLTCADQVRSSCFGD